jgi:hypothetical protein
VEQRNQRTKMVALGGILLSMSLVTLFLASFIPGAELSLYALSSLYVAIIIIETKAKNGWIFYVASCLLAFLIIPNKLVLLPYVLFFGLYGVVKYYIEKIGKQAIEIVLKLVFFTFVWGIGTLFFRELLLGNIELPNLPVLVLIIGALIMFLVYDYLFTLMIGFYQKRFPKA